MNTPENVAVVIQLIKSSTSPLGDFELSLCIQKIRNNDLVGLFHSNSRLLDILLSRYKEHVSFWKIGDDLSRKELGGLADLLGLDIPIIFALYNNVPQILWRQNAFECSKCGYVGPPGTGAGCPKCGAAWKTR